MGRNMEKDTKALSQSYSGPSSTSVIANNPLVRTEKTEKLTSYRKGKSINLFKIKKSDFETGFRPKMRPSDEYLQYKGRSHPANTLPYEHDLSDLFNERNDEERKTFDWNATIGRKVFDILDNFSDTVTETTNYQLFPNTPKIQRQLNLSPNEIQLITENELNDAQNQNRDYRTRQSGEAQALKQQDEVTRSTAKQDIICQK